jgi:DNA replication protein DnaC
MTLPELQATLPEQLRRVDVPEDIRSRLLQPYSCDTPAMLAVRRFLASEHPMVVLIGGNGCGKTFAACSAIAENYAEISKKGFLEHSGDILPWWGWRGSMFMRADRIAALNIMNDEEDQATGRRLLKRTLLIVDDLGLEDGDGERGIGRLLCDRIGGNDLRTIITSNLSRERVRERYGNRLMSRLGEENIVSVHGPDLRRTQ